MPLKILEYVVLLAAAIPFIFYILAVYSSSRYFWQASKGSAKKLNFTPPVSNLKPVKGLDPALMKILPVLPPKLSGV